jgi:hypothetical protein
MSDDVCFPVFVLAKDCGEITEYSSLTAMQGYLEGIDVDDNEYDAWDAQGYVLRLAVTTPKSAWLRVSRTDSRLLEQELAELKAKSRAYREPEPLLSSLRRRLFGK